MLYTQEQVLSSSLDKKSLISKALQSNGANDET